MSADDPFTRHSEPATPLEAIAQDAADLIITTLEERGILFGAVLVSILAPSEVPNVATITAHNEDQFPDEEEADGAKITLAAGTCKAIVEAHGVTIDFVKLPGGKGQG